MRPQYLGQFIAYSQPSRQSNRINILTQLYHHTQNMNVVDRLKLEQAVMDFVKQLYEKSYLLPHLSRYEMDHIESCLKHAKTTNVNKAA